jgi:hypothetical protein
MIVIHSMNNNFRGATNGLPAASHWIGCPRQQVREREGDAGAVEVGGVRIPRDSTTDSSGIRPLLPT